MILCTCISALTENEHNLVSDEGEHSETAAGELRWREPSLDRVVAMEEEDDEQEMHRHVGMSSDPDQVWKIN